MAKQTNFQKYGFTYVGNVNSSSKIEKSNEVLDIDTYVMYLAPHSLSGHNVCAGATIPCIVGCLNTSGRAKMDTSYRKIMNARINKTKLFYSDRKQFNAMLFHEIAMHKKRSENKDKDFAVRLNGTSDLSPVLFTNDGKNVLDTFKDVTFYDYTKIVNRVELAKKYRNYDLTFSYNGDNWNDCEYALKNNVRVAVIFNLQKGEKLPKTFKGVKVIDGDKYDYRPIDGKNVIVGLRWKKIRNKAANNAIKHSSFVVQPNDSDCKF